MYSFQDMENNINMNYKDLIITIVFLLLVFSIVFIIGFLFLRLGFHLVVSSKIHNKDVEIKVSFRCFFNLINITKVVYTTKEDNIKNKNKEKKKIKKNKIKENNEKVSNIDLKKIQLQDLLVLYRIIRKIQVVEVYSDLNYGSDIMEVTSFIFVFINIIYGNIYNYIDSKKMYLNVTPCYTNSYINHIGKLHIRINIKDIISLLIGIIRIFIKVKKCKNNKEEKLHEISKFYKEFNGYNT